MKPKTFDFLKKRREGNESNTLPPSYSEQNLKPFQPLKKSDMMWPLSISPM